MMPPVRHDFEVTFVTRERRSATTWVRRATRKEAIERIQKRWPGATKIKLTPTQKTQLEGGDQ